MNTILLLCSAALAAVLGAAPEVLEKETGTSFPATLTVGATDLTCTGTAVRQVYGFDVYALAHYGDPSAAPDAAASPEDKLAHWINASHTKAMRIHFVFSADKQNMRERAQKALDAAGYPADKRDKFLDVFARDYPSGSEVMLLAEGARTLKVVMNGKDEGAWDDAELVRALWNSWLGEDSVLKKREGLVSRD